MCKRLHCYAVSCVPTGDRTMERLLRRGSDELSVPFSFVVGQQVNQDVINLRMDPHDVHLGKDPGRRTGTQRGQY